MPTQVHYVRICDHCEKTSSTQTLDLPEEWPLIACGNVQRYVFCSWACLVAYAAVRGGDLTPPPGEVLPL